MSKDKQTLYRHFGADGELLYVGVTSRIPSRIKDHSKQSHWWLNISRIELEHFDSREAVLEAERAAIINEKPKHNIHHARGSVVEMQSRTEIAKETIVARIVTLRPLYKVSEVSEVLGIGAGLVRRAIEFGDLGYVDLAAPRSGKLIRYVSGWQILDWLEDNDARPSVKAA